MKEIKRYGSGLSGQIIETPQGSFVDYDDHAEIVASLQEQVRALAAEADSLKKFCKNAAFYADYESELVMERGGFTDGINDIKTSATDAALREIRAQAVDDFVSYHNFSDKQLIQDEAKKYAAAIRSGEQP